MGELKASPEWHLTVSDASGKALFKLQLTAEIGARKGVEDAGPDRYHRRGDLIGPI
jgi:hypothetical protein